MSLTPGPWIIREEGPFLRVVGGEDRTTVAAGLANDANARLIAAAPELLAALELLVSAKSIGDPVAARKARDVARAAIAKATADQVVGG